MDKREFRQRLKDLNRSLEYHRDKAHIVEQEAYCLRSNMRLLQGKIDELLEASREMKLLPSQEYGSVKTDSGE